MLTTRKTGRCVQTGVGGGTEVAIVTAPKPVPEPSLFPELNMFLGVPNYPPRVSRIVGNAGAELAG